MDKFDYRAIILIFLAGIIVYANSLFNPFIWDDSALVRDNFLIKDWRYAGKLFATDLYYSASHSNFYRPLQGLSYMFDYSLWRLNPFGYHLTNIILHSTVAILAYFLFLLASKQKGVSLIGALLFVTHPVHTEAVAYIAGRADSLMGLFLLSSFILFLLSLRGTKCQSNLKRRYLYFSSLACFSLALFCKEAALIFPFTLLLTKLKLVKKEAQVKFYSYLPFFILVFAYILFRFGFSDFSSLLGSAYSFKIRLLVFFKTLTTYLGILFFPINLHMSRNVVLPPSFFNLPVLSSFLVFLIILILALRCYRRLPLIFFGYTWFFILLIPQSGLFPQNAFLAEHFLYLPSLGFFLLVSYGLLKLCSKKTLILILIPVFAVYGFLTIKRNREWKEPVSFYEKMVRLSPLGFAGHNNLGLEYEGKQLYDQAIAQYKRAIEIKENFREAHTNIARAYYKQGQKDKAIKQYLEVLKRYPDYDLAHAGLAGIYAENKEYDKAIERYRQTIRISPHWPRFYNCLGLVYNEMQEFDLAIEEFKKAIAIDNKDSILHNNLGVVYKQKGWYDKALAEYFQALRLKPDFAEAYNNLGIIYHKSGQYERAEESFQRAIRLQGDYPDAYYNLGALYWEKGEWDKCRKHWQKALELEPGHQLAKEWLNRLSEEDDAKTKNFIP